MDHELNLEIVNDTPFQNLTYILALDHKAEKTVQRQAVLRKDKPSETNEISVKLRKKDVWSTGRGAAGRFWLFMDVLDICFGSLTDCAHLPFSLDYKDHVDCDKGKKILLLSRMLHVDRANVALWSRYTAAQYALIAFLLFIVVLLASAAFEGVWQIVWLIGFAALIGLLFVMLIRRRNRLKKELLDFAAKETAEVA